MAQNVLTKCSHFMLNKVTVTLDKIEEQIIAANTTVDEREVTEISYCYIYFKLIRTDVCSENMSKYSNIITEIFINYEEYICIYTHTRTHACTRTHARTHTHIYSVYVCCRFKFLLHQDIHKQRLICKITDLV